MVEGELIKYAQFPGSDCRNGAVVRVKNGHAMVKELASHHYIVTGGNNTAMLEYMGSIFEMDLNKIE